MYWFVFGVLLINASICFLAKKEFKLLYYVCIIMLTLFLCLRYGQGADYFGYKSIFDEAPDILTFSHDFYAEGGAHGEIGWKLLCHAFHLLNLSYPAFVAFIGLLSMFFIHLFICRMCPSRSLALLLIFPTLYLTYFFSGMRQGLAMSFFLGIVLKCLFSKRYVLYILGVALCMTFHFTAFMYFIPLFFSLFYVRSNATSLFFYLCVAAGFVLSLPFFQELIQQLPLTANTLYYLSSNMGTSWAAVFERVVMLGVVVACYSLCKKPDRSPVAEILMPVYIASISLYILFFWFQMFSRIIYPLKLFEILLLSSFLPKLVQWRKLVFTFIILFSFIMVYKNLGSYIAQGGYINTSVINYPYISIFNQEDIYRYLPKLIK